MRFSSSLPRSLCLIVFAGFVSAGVAGCEWALNFDRTPLQEAEDRVDASASGTVVGDDGSPGDQSDAAADGATATDATSAVDAVAPDASADAGADSAVLTDASSDAAADR